MKLEIGYNHEFEIRQEFYPSTKQEDFSVLYISDLHLNGYSQNITIRLIEKIDQLNPTIILLGGDYIDTKKGMMSFLHLLKYISLRKNVFAVAGNHDYYFGIHIIKDLMIKNNVIWIEKETTTIFLNNYKIEIIGNKQYKEKSSADFSILCLHKPIDINPFNNSYNLVFAGHLHGSQFVFLQTLKGLYPGRLFYKWNILKTKINDCYYLISKGLGDTLPIRYNCKKDIIFVEIANNS